MIYWNYIQLALRQLYGATIFTPARDLPQRDSLFWFFLRGFDPLSMHGSYFAVLAV
jgi:hypothetical protein